MQTAHRAELVFSVSYVSDCGSHRDTTYLGKVDFWRDLFPEEMKQKLMRIEKGLKCSQMLQRGELLGGYSNENIVQIDKRQLFNEKTILVPGRYYPSTLVYKQLRRFPGDMRPFRVTGASEKNYILDLNHPLANYDLTLEAEVIRSYPPAPQRGGHVNDISEVVFGNGPGMQVPLSGLRENIYGSYPFHRRNSVSEEEFYTTPRLVKHLDERAGKHVETVYASILETNMRILDLMASVDSHLPESFRDTDIVGLGLNAQEMRSNILLNEYVIHNLNSEPFLPFPDSSFDAVICTSSIEYLCHPFAIIKEIARILRQDGTVCIVVSDRWFPGEEVSFWSDLHSFERQGFVLNLLRSCKSLKKLHSESFRGFPRPLADVHFAKTAQSDPVFAVWATKTAS